MEKLKLGSVVHTTHIIITGLLAKEKKNKEQNNIPTDTEAIPGRHVLKECNLIYQTKLKEIKEINKDIKE